MSLNWDISRVRDYKQASIDPLDPEKIHPVLYYLIFAMMPIGMSGITEANKAKVFERLSIYQRMTGPAMTFTDDEGKRYEVYVTMADIERYIGLGVNVSNESDAWFAKNVWRWAKSYRLDVQDNPGDLTAMDYIANRAKEKTTC